MHKSNKRTPDWSLVYPELAGIYEGGDEDFNPTSQTDPSVS
jgi:hypothetical protein